MEMQHRKYIRHPIEIPIQILAVKGQVNCSVKNLSQGGVCVEYDESFNQGEKVDISIDICKPEFNVKAIVSWCKKQHDKFFIGVSFLNADDAFSARMVEQLCHIERYRIEVHEQTGQQISNKQAAQEWISMFASTFPKF